MFYKSLKEDVKDRIAEEGKPATLAEIIQQAIRIDNRQYTRRMESGKSKAKSNTSTNSNDKKPNPQNQNGNNGNSNFRPNNPNYRVTTSNTTSNSSNPPARSSNDPNRPPPKGTAMGTDGKYHLTKAAREFRMKNNLCLRCGKSGHVVKDCNVSSTTIAVTNVHAARSTSGATLVSEKDRPQA